MVSRSEITGLAVLYHPGYPDAKPEQGYVTSANSMNVFVRFSGSTSQACTPSDLTFLDGTPVDLRAPEHRNLAVKFKWQKDEKTYDYFIPEGVDIKVGQKVAVETKRGETTVEVVEIKTGSDRAEKSILRIAEERPQQAEGMDF